ncbi:MAG: hypothetical protein QOI73_2300 [Solirubrobacteraceae bacterium]|nr:hypothetical protein [Solirubrobacteraceae bacterium]
MQRVNLADQDFDYDAADPQGFRSGMARFGARLGAECSGASLYELPPGEALCPYHYEYGEEEWLLVLSGRPSLRHPCGADELRPLDLLCFVRGPEGAHQIRNDGDETARVLMWSTVVLPTATVYPDSDKIGIWTGHEEDDVMVHRSSAVEYFDGEGERA